MDIAQKDRIVVKDFGPIREVYVELGDLTVLIGAHIRPTITAMVLMIPRPRMLN